MNYFCGMPIEVLYKKDNCEWIDVVSATIDDLQFLHQRYDINMLLLDDTIDANHLPKFEEDSGVKFFLMRENTELERHNLNSISDVSTKLGVFLVGKVIITIHRLQNKSISEYSKEILNKKNGISTEKIALKLALKVIRSYDNESAKLLEKLDLIENEIFLKNVSSSNYIRRLYKLKRKSGLNTRILNISADWVNHFRILDISEAEFTDLQDKYKDVVADFDHLNAQVTNLISMYLAMADQKANQVMKLLAMYSVYFLPITFIAGLYGMNFKYMPELTQKYGYYATLGLMFVIVVVTFFYFKRKKW